MRLLLLFALLFHASPVTLTTDMTDPYNLFVYVQTDAPRLFVVEVETTGGVHAGDATLFQFDLSTNEQFGRRLPITSSLTGGSVYIRIETSDNLIIERTIPIPPETGMLHIFFPVMAH